MSDPIDKAVNELLSESKKPIREQDDWDDEEGVDVFVIFPNDAPMSDEGSEWAITSAKLYRSGDQWVIDNGGNETYYNKDQLKEEIRDTMKVAQRVIDSCNNIFSTLG